MTPSFPRLVAAIAWLMAGLPATTWAQQAAPAPLDYDSLAACSVVYQQVSSIYAGRSDAAKATEFSEAATAYAASGLHILGYEQPDAAIATEFAESRMVAVVEALNAASAANPDGDMGVIAEWLPFCDSLGPQVTEALAARTERGW